MNFKEIFNFLIGLLPIIAQADNTINEEEAKWLDKILSLTPEALRTLRTNRLSREAIFHRDSYKIEV